MKKMSLIAFLACGVLYAGPLSFESGVIKAHTEVFGDSSIDPTAKRASSRLSMDENPESLRGMIEVSMVDLISDNKKRDTSMQETFESAAFPKAVFEIKEVAAKGANNYLLKGAMSLHGITKPLSFEGAITQEGPKVHIKVSSMIKMSDFGIKPPRMVFLTVRDQVDVSADVLLKR